MFFDTHAHLTCDELYPNIQEILTRARESQVEGVTNICTDRKTLDRGLELAKQYHWIYNAAATTPHDVEQEGEENFPIFEQAAQEGVLIAIGETGLDYFYEHSNRELQKRFLVRYLDLAKKCSLPVIFHCRDAFTDLFQICDEYYRPEKKIKPAILHCFTGTWLEAKEVIDRGWFISFSGIITFKKSEELREVVTKVPMEHILIETDSPYLAPQRNRGHRNEPSFITETAQLIADIKKLDINEVAKITSHNAFKAFNLDSEK